jgi:hypothetical protein
MRMKKTRIMVKKTISTLVLAELIVLATYLYSSAAFINVQVAFLSSLFVILGSAFAYNKMVHTQVASGEYEEKRDLLDEIEDPHELYDEKPINDTPAEELDLKEIVKEERAKIKTFSLSSIKHGARGSISLFRLVPYVLLTLGFIALKNNELLELKFYLPSLLLGIVVGSIVSRKLS